MADSLDSGTEIQRRALEYFNSPEGQEVLRQRRERTDRAIKELREARKVDWRTLHRPTTI